MPEPVRPNGVEFVVSSFSGGGDCVEVGRILAGGAIVRDTKDPARKTVLTFSGREWDAFLGGVKNGDFTPR
jgi:hypothetical protein